MGGGHELVLRAEAAIVLAEADRLEEAEPRLHRAIVDLDAADRPEDRIRVAGALAGALERAGRTEEAAAVWARSGGALTGPTGR